MELTFPIVCSEAQLSNLVAYSSDLHDLEDADTRFTHWLGHQAGVINIGQWPEAVVHWCRSETEAFVYCTALVSTGQRAIVVHDEELGWLDEGECELAVLAG